jgi:hypothetical protein
MDCSERGGSRRRGRPVSAKACGLALATILSCLGCTAAGARAPEPPVRPAAPAPKPPPPQPSTPPVAAPQEDAATCLAKLAESGAAAEPVPAPPAPLPECVSATPVRLTSIRLASGAPLELPDGPILNCEFAIVFTDYARNLMAPLAASLLGSPVASLATGPGYECRGRNQVAGAKTSAHGKGIAIDVASIVLADHRRIGIAHPANPTETLFLQTMRHAACGWFTTVLGPGSDPSHAEHLHFDIERHGASERYRICD